MWMPLEASSPRYGSLVTECLLQWMRFNRKRSREKGPISLECGSVIYVPTAGLCGIEKCLIFNSGIDSKGS